MSDDDGMTELPATDPVPVAGPALPARLMRAELLPSARWQGWPISSLGARP
jgi:hypothetical protein